MNLLNVLVMQLHINIQRQKVSTRYNCRHNQSTTGSNLLQHWDCHKFYLQIYFQFDAVSLKVINNDSIYHGKWWLFLHPCCQTVDGQHDQKSALHPRHLGRQRCQLLNHKFLFPRKRKYKSRFTNFLLQSENIITSMAAATN